MIKSPLRYPGGKSRAAELIASLIPNFEEFREPFLGGGSVFIHLKQKFPNKKFWGNDIYKELYKFWQFSQIDIDALKDKIYEWRKKYSVGKELYKFLNENLYKFEDLEIAAAFFIYNRITFSGTSLSGGFSESAFADRFTESSIQRLNKFSEVIQNATITNYDYKDVIFEDGDDVIIFLDPPYYSATKSALYGKNGDLHKSFNHIEFADTMQNCNHKWLITYDDSEYIRNLFRFANIIPWNLTYGMRNVTKHSNQKGKELFISNFLESIHTKQNSIFNA
jgi:DNA adenine methylase